MIISTRTLFRLVFSIVMCRTMIPLHVTSSLHKELRIHQSEPPVDVANKQELITSLNVENLSGSHWKRESPILIDHNGAKYVFAGAIKHGNK